MNKKKKLPMQHTFVVLDGYTLNPGDLSWDPLAALGNVTVYDRTGRDERIERIGPATIILTNKVVIDRSIIEQCSNLRYIGVLATGYNTVDIEAANEHHIVVTNIPTYGTAAVAQFAVALLLEICHRVGHHSVAVSQGRWQASPDFCFWDYPLIELAGKTMGIIGFGRIGQATSRIAKALGMRVIAYDVYPVKDYEEMYVSLDALFATSDVITLHCPLSEETRGIICKETIAKMKDGVIILNNSRGPLIVEQDLANALKSGKVYAAGLDVVSSEPIQADNPLLQAPNCFITPHISWAPKESRQRLMDIAVANVKGFLAGQVQNQVH